jgi:hypothetical protein
MYPAVCLCVYRAVMELMVKKGNEERARALQIHGIECMLWVVECLQKGGIGSSGNSYSFIRKASAKNLHIK